MREKLITLVAALFLSIVVGEATLNLVQHYRMVPPPAPRPWPMPPSPQDSSIVPPTPYGLVDSTSDDDEEDTLSTKHATGR